MLQCGLAGGKFALSLSCWRGSEQVSFTASLLMLTSLLQRPRLSCSTLLHLSPSMGSLGPSLHKNMGPEDALAPTPKFRKKQIGGAEKKRWSSILYTGGLGGLGLAD